jgi:hypothetical protein
MIRCKAVVEVAIYLVAAVYGKKEADIFAKLVAADAVLACDHNQMAFDCTAPNMEVVLPERIPGVQCLAFRGQVDDDAARQGPDHGVDPLAPSNLRQ